MVITWLDYLHIDPLLNMTTAAQRASAQLMIRDGHSLEQVAGFFGVKPDTVRAWYDPEFAKEQSSKFKARAFKKSRGWQ